MRETAINWDNENNEVMISTSETNIKERLDKLCSKFPKHYKFKGESDEYKNYICLEKKLIKFSKPVIYSEEQKEKLRTQARKNFNLNARQTP